MSQLPLQQPWQPRSHLLGLAPAQPSPLSPWRELANITEINVSKKQMMKGKYEFEASLFLFIYFVLAFISLFLV